LKKTTLTPEWQNANSARIRIGIVHQQGVNHPATDHRREAARDAIVGLAYSPNGFDIEELIPLK
jgi:hypothetical protein